MLVYAGDALITALLFTLAFSGAAALTGLPWFWGMAWCAFVALALIWMGARR